MSKEQEEQPQQKAKRFRIFSLPRVAKEHYRFINKDLLQDTYQDGDVYKQGKLEKNRELWQIAQPERYLKHVKYLANAWPHLRILADFMEIGTSPLRWGKKFHITDKYTIDDRQRDQNERWTRANVARLDYLKDGDVAVDRYTTPAKGALRKALDIQNEDLSKVQVRLWVVEDLSRDVIELLGSKYDVEPAFFREHILDYAWHNVRDYWRNPPNLDIVTRKQHWTQLRYVRARYFLKTADFKTALEQAEDWNIFRRPDDDENNKTYWDQHEAKVALLRSRASFWLKRPEKEGDVAIGILLLDPTLQIGCPLWQGYRNWETAPGLYDPPTQLPSSPEQNARTFFEDFIYWATKPDVFTELGQPPKHALLGESSRPRHDHSHIHVPIQALLHLVCAEWLTISDYIKTRLTQIDWEIAYPETFLQHRKPKEKNKKHKPILHHTHEAKVDVSLKKLHIWRRYVPIFREMISETLARVFEFPCNVPMRGNAAMGEEQGNGSAGNGQATGGDGASSSSSSRPGSEALPRIPTTTRPVPGAIKAYQEDFKLALGYMIEYQERIDRLTSVVTAVMSIADSRRALNDNRNIGRLTWLATLFVPASLIAAMFSMQDLQQSSTFTWRVYFGVTIPVCVITFAIAVLLSLDSVQALLSRWKEKLGFGGGLTGFLESFGSFAS